MYEKREYRNWMKSEGLIPFEIKVETTDLYIMADIPISSKKIEIENYIKRLRKDIVDYSKRDMKFIKSLLPLEKMESKKALLKRMHSASREVGVGPMASVAGGFSEFLGKFLLRFANEVIVENGGDIYINIRKDSKVMIFSGIKSKFSGMKIKVNKEDMPIGICTSSGRIGPSISLGDADGVCVLSKDTFFADALATKVANIIKKQNDIDKALKYAREFEKLEGIIIIRDNRAGIWGKVEIVK